MSIQLSPDIEAGLRAEAAARSIEVDTLVATAVQVYLRSTPRSQLIPAQDRSAEMAWAANPDPRFFGKWVVLDGGHVAASGPDPNQLYEDARAIGFTSPFLIFVSPDENDPFVGGWID